MKKWLVPLGIFSFFALAVGVVLFVPSVKSGVIETMRGTVKDTNLVVKPVEEPTVEYVSSDNTTTDSEITTDDGGEIAEMIPTLEIKVLPTKGDALIVKEGNAVALINAGFKSDVPVILSELKKLGVKRLKYIVSLNNHSSSVGGLTGVADALDVDYILLSGSSEARKESLSFVKYLNKEKLLWSVPSDNAKYRLKNAYLELKSTTRTGSLYASVVNGVSRFTAIGTTIHFPKESVSKVGKSDILLLNTSSQGYKLDASVVSGIAPRELVVNDIYGNKVKAIKKTYSSDKLKITEVAKGKAKTIYSDGKEFRIE